MSKYPPVIIKKYKKSHQAAHGGAWKIAYADFITSMMALFLLMWLISVTTEETKRGISEYFTTSIISMKSANAGTGIINGDNASTQNGSNDQEEPKTEENKKYNSYNSNVSIQNNQHIQQMSTNVSTTLQDANKQQQGTIAKNINAEFLKKTEEKELEENVEEIANEIAATKQAQEEIRQSIENSIRNAFNSVQEVEKFKHNLIIELTDEGIRIQIVDSSEHEMFKTGSAIPAKFTETIIRTLGEILTTLPNKIEITGHTDSLPYRHKKYSNWELSADRANSTRRILEESGVKNDRFEEVNGRADKDPLNKIDPKAPENRRVSITVLYNDSQQSLEAMETEDQKNNNSNMPKIIL